MILKTPSDFSDEESELYEQHNKSAKADFLHEFDHGMNLWDRFLDILAGVRISYHRTRDAGNMDNE